MLRDSTAQATENNASAPNNFGPFVMIVLGLLLSPAVVGIPLLLFAISRIRSLDGRREFDYLFPWTQA